IHPHKNRESMPEHPAVSFPGGSAEASKALAADFELIRRREDLPASIQPAFKDPKDRRWAIANPGQPFNATDVVVDPWPMQRMIFAGKSSDAVFVYYEQGGRGYSLAVVGFSPDKAEPLWKVYCSGRARANDLAELREMLAEKKCGP